MSGFDFTYVRHVCSGSGSRRSWETAAAQPLPWTCNFIMMFVSKIKFKLQTFVVVPISMLGITNMNMFILIFILSPMYARSTQTVYDVNCVFSVQLCMSNLVCLIVCLFAFCMLVYFDVNIVHNYT